MPFTTGVLRPQVDSAAFWLSQAVKETATTVETAAMTELLGKNQSGVIDARAARDNGTENGVYMIRSS